MQLSNLPPGTTDQMIEDAQEDGTLAGGWLQELPTQHGWYFMRRKGEKVIAEGLCVWVGYNASGVRYEGRFFYPGEGFLRNQEFFGPLEPVNAAEVERIRICAYLGFDTTYSSEFCVRCSHCPSNCECPEPVYMEGWEPDDTLRALKVMLFTEGKD